MTNQLTEKGERGGRTSRVLITTCFSPASLRLLQDVTMAAMLAASIGNVLPYLFIVLVIAQLAYQRYGHGIHKYRGPFLASLTDFWKFWHVSTHRDRVTTVGLHSEYGPIVRVGPRKLSFSDPAALKEIFGVNKGYVKVGLNSQ